MSWYKANLEKSCVYGALRFKMYADLQEFYKKYLAGELGGTQQLPPQQQPECESTFCDNFESKWVSLNTYVSQFGETFQLTWFTDNSFTSEYKDNFEGGWFMYNDYASQWLEDFEGVDWA